MLKPYEIFGYTGEIPIQRDLPLRERDSFAETFRKTGLDEPLWFALLA